MTTWIGRWAPIVALVVAMGCNGDDGSSSAATTTGDGAATDAMVVDATVGVDAGGDEGPADVGGPEETAVEDAAPLDTGASDTGEGGDADAGSATCTTPLTGGELQQLAFGLLMPSVGVAPGGSHDFELYLVECCYILKPVEVCVEWSVEPAEGATIDDEGKLTIDPDVATGTTYTVTADVESGKKVLTIVAVVTTPESNPLLGTWHEVAQLSCEDGSDVAVDQSIGELAFFPNGEFNVTWTPFEVYVDYWGQYSYDLETQALVLAIVGGNYVPVDFDGEGTFELTETGALVLHDIWFGSPADGLITPTCGHRFQ